MCASHFFAIKGIVPLLPVQTREFWPENSSHIAMACSLLSFCCYSGIYWCKVWVSAQDHCKDFMNFFLNHCKNWIWHIYQNASWGGDCTMHAHLTIVIKISNACLGYLCCALSCADHSETHSGSVNTGTSCMRQLTSCLSLDTVLTDVRSAILMVKSRISVCWACEERGKDFLCYSGCSQDAPLSWPATDLIGWFSIIAGDVSLF